MRCFELAGEVFEGNGAIDILVKNDGEITSQLRVSVTTTADPGREPQTRLMLTAPNGKDELGFLSSDDIGVIREIVAIMERSGREREAIAMSMTTSGKVGPQVASLDYRTLIGPPQLIIDTTVVRSFQRLGNRADGMEAVLLRGTNNPLTAFEIGPNGRLFIPGNDHFVPDPRINAIGFDAFMADI